VPVPSFPQLPEDDPIASLRLFRDYLRDLLAYFSPIKIAIGLVAFTLLICAAVYCVLGFESMLSWASDLVPLLFAVVGIVVSVKKFRDEDQGPVIAGIVIVGILGTAILHLSRIHAQNAYAKEISGLRERMDSWQRQNTELLTSLLKPAPPNAKAAEVDRRQNVERALRGEYLLSHDNVSPDVLAGTEFPPADWMNQRLRELGENWTFTAPKTTSVSPNTPRSYIVFDGPPRFPEKRDDKNQSLPDQNFQVGDQIVFNVHYRATGPNPVELKGVASWMYLEPDSSRETQRRVVADFERNSAEERKEHPTTMEPRTFMPGNQEWGSVYAATKSRQHRVATQNDLEAFRAGTETPFVLVELDYADNGKLHHLRACHFLQTPATAPGVWHFCDGFNHSD
jgi:hypothetical protein